MNLSPLRKKSYRFGLFPFRSPLLREYPPTPIGAMQCFSYASIRLAISFMEKALLLPIGVGGFFSLPRATKMFQFARYTPQALCIQTWVRRYFCRRGFPHSDIPGSQVGCHLPEAYRRLRRPSSFIDVKAFTIRPCVLTEIGTHPNRLSASGYLTCIVRASCDAAVAPEPPTMLVVPSILLTLTFLLMRYLLFGCQVARAGRGNLRFPRPTPLLPSLCRCLNPRTKQV